MAGSAIYYFLPRTGMPTIPPIDNFCFTHDAAHRDAPPTIELQREPTGPSSVLNLCRSPLPTPIFRGRIPVRLISYFQPSVFFSAFSINISFPNLLLFGKQNASVPSNIFLLHLKQIRWSMTQGCSFKCL